MTDDEQGGATTVIDRIHVHCEVRGSGRPLLLILGLGADVSEHTALIDALATHSQVIAFDNRGSGRSDKPDAPYTIELMAADALGVLDLLGVGHADILGMSLGGRIALELALRHPDRVDKLILLSTSARTIPSWPPSLKLASLASNSSTASGAGFSRAPPWPRRPQSC